MPITVSEMQQLTETLAWFLRKHDDHYSKKGRMPFLLPSLMDTSTYAGVRLRDIFLPPVPNNFADSMNVFDSWLYGYKIGEDENSGREDIVKACGKSLRVLDFIDQGRDLGEKTVRLLVALGHAPNATWIHSEHTICVRFDGQEFGIFDGVVKSRFCDGLELPVDIVGVLYHKPQYTVIDRKFVSLYREALRKGGGSVEALLSMLALFGPKTSEHLSRVRGRVAKRKKLIKQKKEE